MSTPAIPTGYRRLRVGWKRGNGYAIWSKCDKEFKFDRSHRWTGIKITQQDMEQYGPYIAPVRRRKGGKKGRAK